MKRFLIALFLSLSFSLFAEPFLGFSGATLGKSYDEVITAMQQDNWVIKEGSLDGDDDVKGIELNKIEDDVINNVQLLFIENNLASTMFQITFMINNSNQYIARQKCELFSDKLISQYNCKQEPDGIYITENNVAIGLNLCETSYKNQIIGYSAIVSYYY